MNDKKNIYLTICISLFLFLFVTSLIYIIYCYAFYDINQENIYTDNYNNKNYNFVYENLIKDSDLTYEDFEQVFNLIYNKNNLKNIYYLYYKDNTIYKNLDSFISTYYYGNRLINREDITFLADSKTTLFNRRQIKYYSINLTNQNNQTLSLGEKKNITLKIENNAKLILDDKELTCSNNECKIGAIFGGLHTIKYSSNNNDYFSLISINQNHETIDITTIDTLVKTNETPAIESKPKENADISLGNYRINKCFLDGSCASKTKSYLTLNEDGTANYYIYIPYDKAGDEYIGNYKVQGDFLILSFKSHTYSVFDYDTKQTTNIEAEVDTEIRFKIKNKTTLSNDSYELKYSAE